MTKQTIPITVLWFLGGGMVAWVFSLYLQPAFAQLLADQLWMCF